ncbi:major facilitator superfamily domain-containing protein [Mycena albidolilacea]|uniref:Major facilitator superfamily domain-containing protein n=1 Tax=Mycena albidolilacea TaxID=1033008 RepID=A0AAD6YXY9_9AGAR|nr:major facilitator superfamily domain-containing protein [Mycena albidolilacea]
MRPISTVDVSAGIKRTRQHTPSAKPQTVNRQRRLDTLGWAQSQVNLPVEDNYPRGIKLAVLTLALGLSVFLVALDNTIIAAAIPKITDDFHSLSDVGWYGSFYTYFPIKWVYVISIAIFEGGSFICGAAPCSIIFIIGRAIAGIGNAWIFAGTFHSLVHTGALPLEKQPLYTGMIGGKGGIGSVAGPILGGVITDKRVYTRLVGVGLVEFRFCFYLSLPIGAITLAIVEAIDSFGTLVFVPAITSLLLALQWGGSKYPWSSGLVIGLLVAFAEKATIPPRILKRCSIWSSSLFTLCIGGSFIIITFYLPIWFQVISGDSAVHSGIDILPVMLALVFGTVIAGALITTIGYYAPFVILSSILTVVGTGMFAGLSNASTISNWLPFEILCGLGVGLGMQQPMLAAQAVLDIKDVPICTAVVMFANTLGEPSIAQNVFTTRLEFALVATVPGVSPALVLSAGADSLKDAVAPEFLRGVLIAYNQALSTTFLVAMALGEVSLAGAFVVEWRSVMGKKMAMAMAA